MLNRFFGTKLQTSMRMCKTSQLLRSSQAGFASKSKEGVFLNENWLAMANKETKGKVNVKEKLIKETNEQMLIKPIYTKEDWSPPE